MKRWSKTFILTLEGHLRPTAGIKLNVTHRPSKRSIDLHIGLNYTHWYIWCLGQLNLGRRRHLYFQKHPGLGWRVFIVKFHGPEAMTYDQHRLTLRGWVDETPIKCKRRRNWGDLPG